VGRKKTPVRIFTPKGRKREAAFAAQAIPQLLRRLEDYYDLPYPFEKLDHVPVPQFFGAMENAGLITYEETLLLSPPDRETIGFKRTCANVTTHEMAHQWFGDLVTMSWWDDVWLNESFATWISPKIVDDWQPDWRTALDQLSSTFSAMRADSLVNARCIRQPIEAPSDIDDAFDEITYGKGAAVLGMFEASMGQEPFRKAIRTYFQHHAYQNATASDFLHSLDHTAKQDVGSAFLTFLNQPGVPVLSVRLGAASNGCSTVMLTQRRFLPVGSSGDANRTWKIPLRIDYETKGNELQLATMMGKARESLVIKSEPSDLDWLFLNHGGAGYFDSAYPSELFSNLLQTGSKKFSAAERMTLAHSISETVRSGDLPFGEALALQPQLLADPERRVVEMAAGFMRVRQRIPPEVQANYKRFVLKTVGGLIKGVSWKTDRPETDDQRLQRLALLSLASNAGEETRLISDAKELALAWLKDRQAVPPDEAETIIGVAGRFADASLFASFKAEVKKATDPADRRRLISALGLTKDPQLAKEALDALVDKEFQSVDSLSLLFYLSSHLETSSLVFDYLKQHYDAVVAALPGDVLFSYLPMLAEGFDTSERQKEVESFFSDKDVRLTGGPRIIAQVVEMIHLNQAFNEAQIPSLVQFLKSQ
jgi:alanyl aminopeptidase